MHTSPSHVVVIGLGYVGLPLVIEVAHTDLTATGLDISERVTSGLSEGRSHVDDISDDQLVAALGAGLTITSDPACLAQADVIIICVPTPLNSEGNPDLGAVEGACDTIAEHLQPGALVVLESTTYPGTTAGPVRERLEASGLEAGSGFSLAFSPERIDPGNPIYGLTNTPKVVGGLTPGCTEAAAAFYSTFIDEVVRVSGPAEAEMAKLLENTYRHVNIALVNEMAVFSRDLGVDLWEAIRAASTKPFGFAPFYPGPGVGGHCIPIDPNYLSHRVRSLGYQFRFVELAQEISGRMPHYVVSRVQELLNDHAKAVRGARVLVLGLTYKRDIADPRETPATEVIRQLRRLGAHVTAWEPHLPSFAVDGHGVEIVDAPAPNDFDVAVLLQAHSTFDLDIISQWPIPILDTRGVLSGGLVTRL